MKKLQDILKGFDLEETWDDGTKQYTVKQMHSVYYDYFEVNAITVYTAGVIDAVVGTNCDPFDGITDLDEFHVYALTELA